MRKREYSKGCTRGFINFDARSISLTSLYPLETSSLKTGSTVVQGSGGDLQTFRDSQNIRNSLSSKDTKLLKDGTPILPKAAELYGNVSFPLPGSDRPYIFSSLVLSADGKMAFKQDPRGPMIAKANAADPSGAEADFWVLNMLRAYADAAVIGAGTLQAESDCISQIMDQDLYEQRKNVLKKEGDPLNVVVSFDGTDIPLHHELFQRHLRGEADVMIATSPEGGLFLRAHAKCPMQFIDLLQDDSGTEEIEASPGERPLPVLITGEGSRTDTCELMQYLRRIGISHLLSESPSFTAHLMQEGFLDEYFITYSLIIAGGTLSPVAGFPFTVENHPSCRLESLSIHQDRFLYARYTMEYVHE